MGTTYSEDAISGTRETLDVDWERIEEALLSLENKATERPEGGFTRQEFAEKKEVSLTTAKRWLLELVANGVLAHTPSKQGAVIYYYFRESK